MYTETWSNVGNRVYFVDFLVNCSKNNHNFITKMVQIRLSMQVKQKKIDKWWKKIHVNM